MFKKIYNRLCDLGVQGIILTGGGEPTINPDFKKITNLLESQHVPYGVNSNFNVYAEFTPTFLKVSIDEGDEARYAKMRGANKLRQVVENIKRYRAFLESKDAKTRLGIQCVTKSLEQVERFYYSVALELWAWVDYIQFRPVEMVGANLDYNEIDKYLKHLQKLDRKVYRSYKFDYVQTKFDYCPASWAAITVDVEGMVHYCCNRPDLVIGSIFDEDILLKKEATVPNMNLCERPCRLTGANVQLLREKDQEINFI